MKSFFALVSLCSLILGPTAWAQAYTETVVDISTRPGVTQRFLLCSSDQVKAAVILFAGGHGGLQIQNNGTMLWGANNFLVRTREMFADLGLQAAVVDAPSDRQTYPYLGGFRQTLQHVEDITAVIAWLRQQAQVPVWLVGTSRGTQSVAFIGTQLPLADGGPNGLVLTSTILVDPNSRPVPNIPGLENIHVPVLVAHHRQDGCSLCPYAELPNLMNKLTGTPRKQLLTFDGGENIEAEVVIKIAQWITASAHLEAIFLLLD
jgi:pimeloyl-ACP methyl ester carboxylesterase